MDAVELHPARSATARELWNRGVAFTQLRSIEFILELFASGVTRDEVIKAYPQLTLEAVEEALRYAAQFPKTIEHGLSKNADLYKRLA